MLFTVDSAFRGRRLIPGWRQSSVSIQSSMQASKFTTCARVRRRDGARGSPPGRGAARRELRRRTRRVCRDPRPNGSGKVRRWSGCWRRCCSRTAAARASSATSLPRDPRGAQAREPRLGRGLVLQEDVGGREPELRARFTGCAPRRPRGDSADSGPSRLSRRPPRRPDGAPLARHAAEGGAGARA